MATLLWIGAEHIGKPPVSRFPLLRRRWESTGRTHGDDGRRVQRGGEAEQILIVRDFDAPRRNVWKAFTTPELVRRWWQATRGEMTVCEMDFRIGGKWRPRPPSRERTRGRTPSGDR
jgi:hypothetical protein